MQISLNKTWHSPNNKIFIFIALDGLKAGVGNLSENGVQFFMIKKDLQKRHHKSFDSENEEHYNRMIDRIQFLLQEATETLLNKPTGQDQSDNVSCYDLICEDPKIYQKNKKRSKLQLIFEFLFVSLFVYLFSIFIFAGICFGVAYNKKSFKRYIKCRIHRF